MVVTNLRLLNDGFFELAKSRVFFRDTSNKNCWLAIRPLLIQTDEKGMENILVDTGIGDVKTLPKKYKKYFNASKWIIAFSEGQRGVLGGINQTWGYKQVGLEKSLEKAGLKPDDISAVILTHLHPDHCGANNLFKKAKFFIQSDEYWFAKSPEKFAKPDYLKELMLLDELNYFKICNCDFYYLSPWIKLIKTPGHTPGHQSISIEYKNKVYIYDGDACPTKVHFEKKYLLGINLNQDKAYKSLKELKNMEGTHIFGHESNYTDILSVDDKDLSVTVEKACPFPP